MKEKKDTRTEVKVMREILLLSLMKMACGQFFG